MRLNRGLLLLLFLMLGTASFAGTPTPPPQPEDTLNEESQSVIHREGTEWTDTWIPNAKNTDKPYVLLIGDSITKQYKNKVTRSLNNIANTGYVATSLSVADPLYPVLLNYILGLREYQVIHFNNGLHGPAYSDEQYEAGYEKAIKLIRKYQPNAGLILVLSTSLKDGVDDNFQKTVLRRNEIVKKLAEKYKLEVDDLFSVVEHKNELHKDKYHFNPHGISVLADKVLESLKTKLKP